MSDYERQANASTRAGDEAIDAELMRLAEATESLAPSPGFAEAVERAVMASLPEEAAVGELRVRPALAQGAANDWRDGVTRRGGLVCMAAAAAAALALWWSADVQSDFDAEVMANFDSVEIVE